MQTPISARHMLEVEQREDPGDAKSVSPTMKTSSTQCMHSRSNRRRSTTAGAVLLPSSPSFLLLLAAVIFAAFASSSSSFVHATVTTTTSDRPEEVGETASAWSGGSSRSIKEDKLLDEDELPASSSSRRVDHTVVLRGQAQRGEWSALEEAEISVLRDERDAALEAHCGIAPDLIAYLDKWEKKWMSATAARFTTAGTSPATTHEQRPFLLTSSSVLNSKPL